MSSPTLTVLGCGYVGTAVAAQALARGWQVSALTRNTQRANELRTLGLSDVVVCDLDSEDWHRQLDPKQHFVLNCVSSAGGGLEGYRKSYINGQASLLKWAASGQIGTLVYTSATSVYPQSTGEWVDEESSTQGASASGQLLLEAEALLAQENTGVGRSFILRLAGIYGPERHFLLNKIRAGEMTFPGSPDSWLNLIHRDDITSAIEACFAAPTELTSRIYNLADGNPAQRGEMLAWLAEQCGAAAPAFDAQGQGKRDSGRRNAQGRLPSRRIDITRIRRELGWSPRYTNYRDGFAQLLR